MKRMLLTMLLICMLTGLLCLAAPESQAAEHTDHCYCGGQTIPGHQCETSVSWKPVNTGTVIPVEDGGHYYLEKDMAASITVENGETVTLCLNGHILRAQCPVIVYNGVLNICDCSGGGMIRTTVPRNAKGTTVLISSTKTAVGVVNQYGGTVSGLANNGVYCRSVEVHGGVYRLYGGTVQDGLSDGSVSTDSKPGYGGNVMVVNEGENIGAFTMYGGIITEGKAATAGGNVYADPEASVSVLGGVLENGTANYGGNLHYTGALKMQNAVLRGGVANVQRGNLFVGRGVDLQSNTITQGYAAGKPESIRILRNGTTLSTDHISIAEAVEKMKKDNNPEQLHLQLLADHSESYTLADTIKLDLNGCDLSGITVSGMLYGFDTTTDNYTGTSWGKLSYALQGGAVQPLESYLAADHGDGESFHRYAMQVTHVTIVPHCAGMGYKARLYGDEMALSQIKKVGYEMWLEGVDAHSFSKSFSQDNTLVTLRLENVLNQDAGEDICREQAERKINARPFIVLNDGTRISFNAVSFNFREALNLADNCYFAFRGFGIFFYSIFAEGSG